MNATARKLIEKAAKARTNAKRYELAKQAIEVLNQSPNIDAEGTELANTARKMFHKNWAALVANEEN